MELSTFSPSDVLMSVREPFNKNTVWIYPSGDIIEVKVFNKGWKVVATTEDKGLSKISEELVNLLISILEEAINAKIKKQLGHVSQVFLNLKEREKDLESKITALENKVDKLTKRLASSVKLTKNGL